MLTIRIAGADLVDARRLPGWSRYELARRASVNCRTLKTYETAGDIAPASVGTLTRLVDALEGAGVRFAPDGARLDDRAGRLRNQRKTTRPIVSVARKQAYAGGIAPHHHAEAVELDLVD